MKRDQNLSNQSEDGNEHHDIYFSDTLLITKDEEKNGSSMDMTKSIPPYRILEIVEVTRNVPHPYREFINKSESCNADNQGSLVNSINDVAADTHIIIIMAGGKPIFIA